MPRRASAAEERRRTRDCAGSGPTTTTTTTTTTTRMTGTKTTTPTTTTTIRGRISDPIPISSALDEMLLAKSRRANSYVPVTKIDDIPPPTGTTAEALALASLRRSFAVGALGTDCGQLLSPSPLGCSPFHSHSHSHSHSSSSSWNRLSDYWSPPSRRDRLSQTVSEPAPPPRSALRLSVPFAGSGNAQPKRPSGTIRDALRQLFGWSRRRTSTSTRGSSSRGGVPKGAPAGPVEPVAVPLGPMRDQLKMDWTLDESAPIRRPAQRPPLRRESSGGQDSQLAAATVTDYNRALRSHSVGLDDVLAIRGAARDSVAVSQRQSCASTESSCPVSPMWTGPTALKPRPAATDDRRARCPSPARLAGGVDASASSESSPRRMSPVPSPRPASGVVRHAPSPSLSPIATGIRVASGYFGCLEEIEGSHPLTVHFSGETLHECPVAPTDEGSLGGAESSSSTAAHTTGLQTRLSGIEDHLHRVEALLTRVSGSMPIDQQPRSGDPKRKLPAPMGPTTAPRLPSPPSECSSPSSAVYSLSAGQASTIADPFPPLPLRNSASLPFLHEDKASSLTLGPYTALVSLIESERSSSMALESEVRKLSQQVHLLAQSSLLGQADGLRPGVNIGAADVPTKDSVVDADFSPRWTTRDVWL